MNSYFAKWTRHALVEPLILCGGFILIFLPKAPIGLLTWVSIPKPLCYAPTTNCLGFTDLGFNSRTVPLMSHAPSLSTTYIEWRHSLIAWGEWFMCPVQILCFSSEAYASYAILMYMSSYEYEICRPFIVPDNIILWPSKSPTMTWRLPFCFSIVVAK